MWALIQACKPLDENSIYCNLIQCDHFADTCILAELDGTPVGWISGYLLPDATDTLFIWQVAVAEEARGLGLASQMLDRLLRRADMAGVLRLKPRLPKTTRQAGACSAASPSGTLAFCPTSRTLRKTIILMANTRPNTWSPFAFPLRSYAWPEGPRHHTDIIKSRYTMPTDTSDHTAVFARRESAARSYCRNFQRFSPKPADRS